MAGTVFFSVSMSLDGFVAPESHAVGLRAMEGFAASGERGDDPDVQCWLAQWTDLQQWVFPLRFFRENWGSARAARRGVTTTSPGRRSCAPARASWAGACSTSASGHGRRSRPSTPRSSS